MALKFVQNKENKIRISGKLACLATSVLALSACGGGSGGNSAPSLSQASLSITTLEDLSPYSDCSDERYSVEGRCLPLVSG